MGSIVTVLAVLTAIEGMLSAQDCVSTQIARGSVPKVELRILPGQLDRGLPKSFTFVFVNRSGHHLRMPRPTQCIGGNGWVTLRSKFKPLNTRGVASGGGAVAEAVSREKYKCSNGQSLGNHSTRVRRSLLFTQGKASSTFMKTRETMNSGENTPLQN